MAAFSATSATTVTVDRVHCLCLHNGHDRRRCRPCCDFIDWCRYLIKTSSSINKRASTLFHAFHLFTTITNCQWGCLEAARTPKQQHGCRSLLVLLNPWTVTKFVCEVWNLWRVYTFHQFQTQDGVPKSSSGSRAPDHAPFGNSLNNIKFVALMTSLVVISSLRSSIL